MRSAARRETTSWTACERVMLRGRDGFETRELPVTEALAARSPFTCDPPVSEAVGLWRPMGSSPSQPRLPELPPAAVTTLCVTHRMPGQLPAVAAATRDQACGWVSALHAS